MSPALAAPALMSADSPRRDQDDHAREHRVGYSFAPETGAGQQAVTAGMWQARCSCGWQRTSRWSPQDTSGLTALAGQAAHHERHPDRLDPLVP